jgi:hypothetical protein
MTAEEAIVILGEYGSRWAEFHVHEADICENYDEDQYTCDEFRRLDEAYNTVFSYLAQNGET